MNECCQGGDCLIRFSDWLLFTVGRVTAVVLTKKGVTGFNRAFSHDITAAILVFQNNETAAMLVYQENPLGVELFSHVNEFFCSNKLA